MSYRTTRRVEFRHTDAAGIIHFSSFLEYMEEVEHEFLRHRGLSVMMRDDVGPISWPRVSVHCDFRSVVRFEDLLEVEISLARRGEKSVTYAFIFRHEGRLVAEGQMTSVCCRLVADQPPQAIAIPAWIVEKLV